MLTEMAREQLNDYSMTVSLGDLDRQLCRNLSAVWTDQFELTTSSAQQTLMAFQAVKGDDQPMNFHDQ